MLDPEPAVVPAAAPPAAPPAVAGRSLRAYLARLLLLTLGPPVVIGAALAAAYVAEQEHDRTSQARLLADELTITVDRVVQSRLRGLALLADALGAFSAENRPEWRALAESYVANCGAHVVVASPDGQMLMNTRVPEGRPLPRMPRGEGRMAAPLAVASGKPAVSDVFTDPVAGRPLVALAVPVQRAGRTVAVVVATQEAASFQRYLRADALPAGWTMSLRDGAGRVMASTAADPVRAAATPYWFAAPSEISGWSAYVEILPAVASVPLRDAAVFFGGAVLLALAAGLLGGSVAARRLGLAVASLARVHEIAQTREQLERSARERADALAAALAARNTLHQTLARIRDGFVALDRDWRFTFVNRATARLLGQDDGAALVGRLVWDVVPEMRGQPWHLAAERALASGRPERIEAYDAPRRAWFEARIFPGAEGLSLFFSDVSERRRAEEALREIKSLIGASVEKVASGSEQVATAGQTMGEIVEHVKRVSDLIADISAASNEQSQGISQVGDAVSQMDQVTQSNAALVEESAAAADSLKQQAAQLVQAVSVFRLASAA